MYTLTFDVDNSGGVLFSRTEEFFLTYTGRHVVRKIDEFVSGTQRVERYSVKSRYPFVVTISGRYFNDNDGESRYVKTLSSREVDYAKERRAV